ncbi:MAG: acyltransferase family protein [Clostridium sp.]|uniref:acyltransferase family protein n=1 Tax=Clostridium sp. TaxID=1506 RepID=UPI00290540A8|nr:acyltransferase family protein [Clostridium sp.]MDU1279228.1 acyltransferase family protein [Clostridium sp.]
MKRIEWIDICKGLGIMLVVLGHLSVPTPIQKYILSVNMPLFFFLSGYTFNNSNNINIFLKKKFKTLVIPYLIFAMSTYLFWVIIERRIGIGSNVSILKPLIGILYANNVNNWMIFDGVLWFIVTLFCTEVIFYFILKKININKVKWLLITFSIIGYLDSLYGKIRLPFGLNIAITGVVFLGIGYLAKQSNVIEKIKYSTRVKITTISFLITLLISQMNNVIKMYDNYYGNYFYFYVASICGIITWTNVSYMINNNKLLSYIGKNTFLILALHPKFIQALNLIFKKILNFNIDNSILFSILYMVIIFVLLTPLINFVNKHLPFIIGKEKNKKILNKMEI